MTDRTSAAVFGHIFELLAENPTKDHKKLARKIYSMIYEYDFSSYQMDADEACLKLGVAQMGIDPEYPDEGDVLLWPETRGYKNVGETT